MTQEEKELLIGQYKTYPTANISDAMDNLGLRSGIAMGLSALDAAQPRAAGFARTIRQMRRKTAWDGVNLAKQASVIDTKTEFGDLLVIETGGIMEASTGGALLAARAMIRGVQGELTDGCLRDADELAEMGFPAYVAGTCPVKSARIMETVGVDVPVQIGGVQICPGDLVVMDRSGVVVVPAEHVREVLEEAERIKAKEDRIEAMVRGGKSLVEAGKG